MDAEHGTAVRGDVIAEIRGLAAGLEPAFFERLVATYVGDGKRHLDAMRRALAVRDAEAWRLEAHSMKGASASVGAERLAELCRSAESAPVVPDGAAEALLREAHEEFARVRAALAAETSRSSRTGELS
ncbi:MAG: Hpt domain-containing protein [Elusimicrobia bacterium]|nr:Hpt domain-containing protein [Elusimicrobiota bacterium]